jgi:hypothetical protein
MSLLLLLPGAGGEAGPPPEQPRSGVSPVWDPVIYRGPIQQTGLREEPATELRILQLDDEDIVVLLATLI